jgi:hypothetical protein
MPAYAGRVTFSASGGRRVHQHESRRRGQEGDPALELGASPTKRSNRPSASTGTCSRKPTRDHRHSREVVLLPLDPGDWLDDADRAALHKALLDSDADLAAGRLVDSDEVLRILRLR